MKRLLSVLALLVLLSLFAFPSVASAHATRPANPTCSYDGCTGYRVHDTATCANSLVDISTDYPMINHSGRTVGLFEVWHSLTCHAYYATVYSYYGTSELLNPKIDFIGVEDNVTTEWWYQPGQGAGVWADGKMVGHDNSSASECYGASVDWQDYAQQYRYNSYAEFCETS